MKTKTLKQLEQEFFDRLAEKLEKIFEKGELCSKCGRRLPCRSRVILFNAYANLFLRDLLKKVGKSKIK